MGPPRAQAGSVAMRLAGQAAPPPQAVDRRGTVRPPPPVDASPALQSMECGTNITVQNSVPIFTPSYVTNYVFIGQQPARAAHGLAGSETSIDSIISYV
ncbi:hypothetical protein U9M48_003896 [Paspalum notatum var. saurae]|uniref:Uncharacterized protein n=1 Tax=Paspalum notatum var. saurae TaxID=547442 RepID=A0AAQ3SK97_PASNO